MPTTLNLVALDPPDLARIRAVLAGYGLSTDGRYLSGPLIDAFLPAFETSYLGASARSFYGQLFRFRPTPRNCELLYDLAVAGPLLITCEPGPPHIVACGGRFDVRDLTDESVPPECEVIASVDKPAELYEALCGIIEPYRSTFGDRYWR